mgnify:CR=1 FL=1
MELDFSKLTEYQRYKLMASLIVPRHSRYVVDLNRPPDGAPLYPGQAETGVCPTRSFGDHWSVGLGADFFGGRPTNIFGFFSTRDRTVLEIKWQK